MTSRKMTPGNANAQQQPEQPANPKNPPTPPTATAVVEPKAVVEAPEPQKEMSPKAEDVLVAKHTERTLVVGKGVALTANVTSCDKVVVEGRFEGNIKTGTFVLSEGEGGGW